MKKKKKKNKPTDKEPQERAPKDYLLRTWLLFLVVALGLGALYFLPEKVDRWELTKVDLLSDLRYQAPDTTNNAKGAEKLSEHARKDNARVRRREQIYEQIKAEAVASSSNTTQPQEHTKVVSSEDNTIIDMTPEHDGLRHFFAQLRRRSSLGRPVRIAVLGDSFIEGDIFSGSLRSMLQARYGGSGVGWMPLSSETAGFRRTIRHEFKGWKEYKQLHKKGDYPLTGYYFTGQVGDWVRYTVAKGDRPFEIATIYYRASQPVSLSVSTNDGEARTIELPATEREGLEAYRLAEGHISTLKFSLVSGASGFTCYGVSLDASSGIAVDNFSTRGNSGLPLASVNDALNASFCAAHPYDLIILQYGLNIISPKQLDYSHYTMKMGNAIRHLKATTGRAEYLILGVSDRGKKSEGKVVTMPAAVKLEEAQIHLASELGLTFWSTRAAVVRLGGIGKLAERGWAAKDYTHLAHRGGAELASQFLEAFLLEEKYYDAIR